jgi:hypothetical protein
MLIIVQGKKLALLITLFAQMIHADSTATPPRAPHPGLLVPSPEEFFKTKKRRLKPALRVK